MKYFQRTIGVTLFLMFICLNLIHSAKPKRKTAKKVKKSPLNNPHHIAIASLMKKMGSKQTIQKIVRGLKKSCKGLRILHRVKTSLMKLRRKHRYLRTALKKKTVPKNVRNTLYQNFFGLLFRRLLKCSVIRNSKVAWQLKKARKLLKKGKKIVFPLKGIRKLVKATNAKAKKQKGFFAAVRKYYKFLNRKKLIKKLIKKKGGKNPLQKHKKLLKNSKGKLAKIKKLGKNIKNLLKRCVMFKGKWAKKACKKVRKIRRNLRKIGKKLSRKLNKTCKAARRHCIHKGKKKFCRKAHKVCKKAKKLNKKMAKSKRISGAHTFATIVSGVISKFVTRN